MLTPPSTLSERCLSDVLAEVWAIEAVKIDYAPVGFGSHHWRVRGADGTNWFATVDELEVRRRSPGDSVDEAFRRLGAALGTARALRDGGLDFVVAPVPGGAGEVIARAGTRFAMACYPLLAGRQFGWGEFRDERHRQAVLDMIVAVHRAPVCGPVLTDDFAVPHRDEVEWASAGAAPDCGPYAAGTANLLSDNVSAVREAWARYDALVAEARSEPPTETSSRTTNSVVTHGEPHAGNTMLTPAGWRLIDWDTALLAPPERDLWDLDPGDGSLLDAYAAATGSAPRPNLLELYRRRWDLTDLAEYVHRFRRPHSGSEDDDESWKGLREIVSRMAGHSPGDVTP
ncbi:aminoglycoside phosphotransferase family protein [Nocardia sp. BMG51109]|uniref:phosphotransferase n=1 Tax=Nocardia sp. BMG51109 TaxID=1056816 RepID=UPI0018DB0B59|nr:aminoglycoside phosphotransferase family protein [Nocardia sp. BMG51109]